MDRRDAPFTVDLGEARAVRAALVAGGPASLIASLGDGRPSRQVMARPNGAAYGDDRRQVRAWAGGRGGWFGGFNRVRAGDGSRTLGDPGAGV